jgi:hypothetical protein
MSHKSTITIIAVLVVLIVIIGALYAAGLINFNKTTTSTATNTLQSTPEQRAPNIVTTNVVSSALGKQVTLGLGASGVSLNASTFLGGGILPFASADQVSQVNGAYSQVIVSPFSQQVMPSDILGLGNNVTYNTYQIGIFVPPGSGFAVVSFAHTSNSSFAAYLVSQLSSSLKKDYNATSYNSTSISFDIGSLNGSNYVFVAENQIVRGYYLEGMLANYSSYNILILYLTPKFTSYSNFTTILSNQINDIKALPSSSVPSVMASAAQIKSITGLNYKTQSEIAVNFNNTKKLLNEYIDLTEAYRGISSTNMSFLNNTVGTMSGLVAKEMVSGENTTAFTVIGFSNSSAPSAILTTIYTASSGSNLQISNYSGWKFLFENTTNYNYNYVYNKTTGNYTVIKTPHSNTTTVLAVNGKYMIIFESEEENQVFTKTMVESFLSDESSLI